MKVADLITRAMKVMGVLASGEAPTAAEQSDAFDALNAMMDTWANQSLALYATARDTYQLASGVNPNTIGSVGGTLTATRPTAIDAASILLVGNNTEMPLQLLSDAEWQGIGTKTTQGQPTALWVQTGYPLTQLWLNPVPDQNYKLVLYSQMQLGRFASVNVTFDMPPGYEEAIIYNLAQRLCPEFGVAMSPEAKDIATESLASLKRTNTKLEYLRSDAAVLKGGGGPFNLISGDRS
jgi:hypothetical protein